MDIHWPDILVFKRISGYGQGLDAYRYLMIKFYWLLISPHADHIWCMFLVKSPAFVVKYLILVESNPSIWRVTPFFSWSTPICPRIFTDFHGFSWWMSQFSETLCVAVARRRGAGASAAPDGVTSKAGLSTATAADAFTKTLWSRFQRRGVCGLLGMVSLTHSCWFWGWLPDGLLLGLPVYHIMV